MTAGSITSILQIAAANRELLEEIQAVAYREGRMASEMAPRAAATLDALAEGKEVSDADLEHAKKLLEFVSIGTLNYVQRLQQSRMP